MTGDLFAPDPGPGPGPRPGRPRARAARGDRVWDPKTRIAVGTSGYSFRDWIGNFYPLGLPRGEMLAYYTDHFPVVEVNSTYYRIPPPKVMEQMEKKTPPGFRFTVKAPRIVTHEQRLDPDAIRAFEACLAPLAEAGKLDGILLQFPWSFRPGPGSRGLLTGTREAFPAHGLFAEFRNAAWNRPETFAELKELGIGYCVVDEPALPGLMPATVELTTPVGYVRFHGRNRATWWSRNEGDREPGVGGGGNRDLLRYDYLYSNAELSEWALKIQELAKKAEKVYVFFNNCHAGQAAKNAALMQSMLLGEG